jgi:hypothetical protein
VEDSRTAAGREAAPPTIAGLYFDGGFIPSLAVYFDGGFIPSLAAMSLTWPAAAPRDWVLPGGLAVSGPPPARFAVRLSRQSDDGYCLCLVWDRLRLRLADVSRAALIGSDLALILAALGTDLEHLLAQPIHPAPDLFRLAG